MKRLGLYQYNYTIAYEGDYYSPVFESEAACKAALERDEEARKEKSEVEKVISWRDQEEYALYHDAASWIKHGEYALSQDTCKAAYDRVVAMGLIDSVREFVEITK